MFRFVVMSITLQIAVLALPFEDMDLVRNTNFVSTKKDTKA